MPCLHTPEGIKVIVKVLENEAILGVATKNHKSSTSLMLDIIIVSIYHIALKF